MNELPLRIGVARRKFIQRCRSDRLSHNTTSFYRRQIRYYWQWLHERRKVDRWLEVGVLRDYFSSLHKRVEKCEIQPESADAAYRALRALCRWLLEQEEIAANPFGKIKTPRLPDKEPRRVEIEDYKRLMLSIRPDTWLDLRDRLIIVVLFWCGVRVDELINIQLSDINTEKGFLLIRHGKGGDPRYVPLLPVVKFAFVEYIYQRPAVRTDYLFPAASGYGDALDRPVRDTGIRLMLRRRCSVAGIDFKNPHAFRHGIAMHLLNELGADMSFISELLGHKDEKTTRDFYATWKIKGLAEKYAKLTKDSGI